MGHVVFIPYAGGGGGSGAQFISNLYTDDSNYSAYLEIGTGPEVFFTASWSMWFVFRIAQEQRLNTIKLFEIVDGGGQGFDITLGSSGDITFNFSNGLGGGSISTLNNDMPVGRVIVLGVSTDNGDAQVYVQGRQIGSSGVGSFAAATNPSAIAFGGATSWSNDLVEILGVAWCDAGTSRNQQGDVFMSIVNNERMELPASVTGVSNWVSYAVDTGLLDVNNWEPETGSTLTNLVIPLGTVGTNTPVVITSPLHLAHSGWSDINPA